MRLKPYTFSFTPAVSTEATPLLHSDVMEVLIRVRDAMHGATYDSSIWAHVRSCFGRVDVLAPHNLGDCGSAFGCNRLGAGKSRQLMPCCNGAGGSACIVRCANCVATETVLTTFGQLIGGALWCGIDLHLVAPELFWRALVGGCRGSCSVGSLIVTPWFVCVWLLTSAGGR